jgi:hypothetical protein
LPIESHPFLDGLYVYHGIIIPVRNIAILGFVVY